MALYHMFHGFQIGSAVCGAAPSMTALIFGRALCGLGGAGMYTGVVVWFHYRSFLAFNTNMLKVLLSLLTSDEERAQYIGCIGTFWGVSSRGSYTRTKI